MKNLIKPISFANETIIDPDDRYALIVEDNKMISVGVKEQLKSLGLNGIVAENGREAVEKVHEFLFKG